MRPAMQKALHAMTNDGNCKTFLRSFASECLSDKEEDHSLEWKEGLETMSTTQWLDLCEYIRQPQEDLHAAACVTCLSWSLRDSLPSSVVSSLSDVIVHLHSLLLQSPCDAQDAIAQCCEALWISHASGAEAVIPQLIPYLVVQALDGESATAIKRLRDVLDALSLLDFEDTSSRLLKDLLLRCFVSPAFLKTNDGVAILSDLFHLDASFMDDIHEIIRNQVHCQKVSVVKRYGLVYFKAWHTAHLSELPSLLKLEEDCIQPYLYHAIYIQTPALCTKLHAVLHAFFDAKQVCDPMLHRLVEPILWRGLRATNDQVRKQAALVLFQGFPYQNPSATKEEADALMQKQVDVMLQLVQDTSPATRVVAVHGLAKVLSLYWEVIPHDSIQQFLFWLFELVQDASSTPVRVAVLQGLPLVLDNHLSHSVLKSLLPKLSPYLNDKQETVRAAFCRLLVRVKSIRNMHFYDIASVDKCLLRLVVDATRPAVAKPLTNLFMRSYFPQGVSDEAQIARTVSMIEDYPVASRVFYRHVVHFSSIGVVCKLAALLLQFLASTLADINEAMAHGIVWVVVELLQSVAKPLWHSKRYADCRRFLQDQVLPDVLHSILDTYSTHGSVIAGMWHIIALLPYQKDAFVLRALDVMAKFECSSNKLLLAGILQCMVQWGEQLTLIESLMDQLHLRRSARANVALLLVCVEQLLMLCDLSAVAAALGERIAQNWPQFQAQMEPTSAILFGNVIWSLHQVVVSTTDSTAPPPIVLCDVYAWMSSQNKRKADDDVVDTTGSDQRLALVPILCEAMFFALQSATAVEFMQRVIEFAVDEPALNVQLLSMLVATEVDLDDEILCALLTALLEANASCCVWLTQLPHSVGLCRCLWLLLKQDARVAHAINATKWPDNALQSVLNVGLASTEELPPHVVEILTSCRALGWAGKIASPQVLAQLREARGITTP
ncbi:hypothetical protein H310_13542 [Aphanomyces invadans]|uniref:Uncharacterized protein n=1 Tax=Aphanomyces invadans TaxID=157072 RepID=A0A024TEK0_9STRA|nr:hypothetical protein H310_13542 [Aphanomyces invadans]ETV92016.1 hypothetical protein H310_13542 [Aphanomyces invadans]|eukprot:XP_008879313.1 hypothetical protein H310_13542 [Aphanomyces invadans]